MDVNSFPPWELLASVGLIAFFYASVGFGGGSGYLAAMSVFLIPPSIMSSTALVLNVLVASLAFWNYSKEGYYKSKLLWPFLITSLPTAFLGGVLEIKAATYFVLLYLVLTYLAFRMIFWATPKYDEAEAENRFSMPGALISGAIIGLLSGIIGIGGGIFLSPLIVTARWGTPKQAAASSAGFILVNSISGLIGRLTAGSLIVGVFGSALLPVGFVGGVIGSRLGAKYLSSATLRRILGGVLLIAATRYWLDFI